MRISKIRIPKSETKQVNLKEINLTKKPLGSIIALVGRNGAGKSRVLKFVENYTQRVSVENFLEDYITMLPGSLFAANIKTNISNARNIYKKSINPNIQDAQRRQFKQDYTQFGEGAMQQLRKLGGNFVKVVDNDELKQIKETLADNLTFEQILSNAHLTHPSNKQKQQNINEFSALNSKDTIKYFNRLSTELVNDEFNLYLENKDNPAAIQEKIAEEKSFILFSNFQHYVMKFLGKEFKYKSRSRDSKVSSILYFNNHPFDINLLSPGQKTLFAYAILFFILDTNSETNIKDSIIIIDEPEKHLHPEAQILLIDAVKDIVSKSGQLWIATHSINILAHLEYDEIIMLKDDAIIEPSRTTPGNSFNELMGVDKHINELITFITSISEWAYGNFMVQCFKEPDAVFGKNIDDPQFKLFKEFLKERSTVELLDFGAGKGRIGYTIQEDEIVSTKVIYSAYEPDKGNFELLNNVPNKKAIFSNISEIPKNRYDCVVLCNVLHEINPKEWVNILTSIKELLKENGYLLLIEDRYLPKGENAHEFGYLVLGIEETKILLGSTSTVELILDEIEYSERIIFNAFLKKEINPNKDSVVNAIKKLKENCFNNIKLQRKKDKDLNQGRRYANETQLYINSQLALEALKK